LMKDSDPFLISGSWLSRVYSRYGLLPNQQFSPRFCDSPLYKIPVGHKPWLIGLLSLATNNMKGNKMNLFTQEQLNKLRENRLPENRDKDHKPVVKLFLPGTACTWLLSELASEDENIAFGLCDLGLGFPELGNVYLPEILALRTPFKVERDLHFKGEYPLSVYARAARNQDAITENPSHLKQALTP